MATTSLRQTLLADAEKSAEANKLPFASPLLDESMNAAVRILELMLTLDDTWHNWSEFEVLSDEECPVETVRNVLDRLVERGTLMGEYCGDRVRYGLPTN